MLVSICAGMACKLVKTSQLYVRVLSSTDYMRLTTFQPIVASQGPFKHPMSPFGPCKLLFFPTLSSQIAFAVYDTIFHKPLDMPLLQCPYTPRHNRIHVSMGGRRASRLTESSGLIFITSLQQLNLD